MLKDFLKEVVGIVVGKQTEDIIDMLDGKKYVNEFLIAKKLDITINQTRNILYKIADHGLISSTRKKDKRKGWYTYFWRIEIMKSLEFLKSILMKKIEQLNFQIKSREAKDFYVCNQCNVEFNEENALLRNFTCNECGNVFERKDNTKLIREFKREKDKLQKKMSLVDEEINIEQDRLDKIKIKEIKKEEAEKVKKRKANARKRAVQRKKNLAKSKKESVKKTAKKKSSKKPVKKVSKKPAKKKIIKKKSVRKQVSRKKTVKKKPAKKASKKSSSKKPAKKRVK